MEISEDSQNGKTDLIIDQKFSLYGIYDFTLYIRYLKNWIIDILLPLEIERIFFQVKEEPLYSPVLQNRREWSFSEDSRVGKTGWSGRIIFLGLARGHPIVRWTKTQIEFP